MAIPVSKLTYRIVIHSAAEYMYALYLKTKYILISLHSLTDQDFHCSQTYLRTCGFHLPISRMYDCQQSTNVVISSSRPGFRYMYGDISQAFFTPFSPLFMNFSYNVSVVNDTHLGT